ncbi:MAG: transposase [Desulfobacterales bacterium]|nr:transposase [Desulfobacterales bacterium]
MENPKRYPPKPDRKRLRLKGFDYSNPTQVYFLTICASEGTSPFLDKDLSTQIIKSVLFYRNQKGIRLYSYCVMPDHFHLVMSPANGFGVSQLVRNLKTYTTKLAQEKGLNGKLWQKSFYDHILRKDESLLKICEYVFANPVRKGLVARPEEWAYSGMPDPLPL